MEENNNINTEQPAVQETTKKPKNNVRKDIFEILESTFITVFVIVMIFTYLLHPVNVVGSSMVPTLHDNDRIFMSTVTAGISCGDIVVVNNDHAYLLDEKGEAVECDSGMFNECIIKRVIACGGQTVDINFDTSEVFVDGEKLDEEYINEPTKKNDGAFSYPITVPEGYYFVMGDNRNASADSRNMLVGLIKHEQIYGTAVLRYSPDIEIL